MGVVCVVVFGLLCLIGYCTTACVLLGVGWFCLVVFDLLVVCFLWWVSCGLILVV